MIISAHMEILRRSLGAPPVMRRDAFRLITLSNCLVDAHQLRSAWHFDNGYDRATICQLWSDGLNSLLQQVVAYCAPVNTSSVSLRSRRQALIALGRATHVLQDFYAHTNWIELLQQRNEPYRVAPLLGYHLVPQDLPAELCSGFFSMRYFTPRNGFSGCPVENGNYRPPVPFTYCHAQLAKDKPSGYGSEQTPGETSTLFEIALELATIATRQLWDEVHDRLLVTYSGSGERLFRQLAWGTAE